MSNFITAQRCVSG